MVKSENCSNLKKRSNSKKILKNQTSKPENQWKNHEPKPVKKATKNLKTTMKKLEKGTVLFLGCVPVAPPVGVTHSSLRAGDKYG
jgi:hypothetical protein